MIHFIRFHACFSSREGRGGNIHRRTWNTSRSTSIPDSSAGSTPRRDQARSEMQLLHLGRPLGRFHVGLASRACLTSLSWGILDTWPNYRSCVLSIRRSGSTFRALRIWQSCEICREVSHQGRNEGETMPGRRITGGRRKVATVSQVFSSMQYLYSKNSLGSNMAAPNLFLAPGAI